ncbi:MAG: 6-phosphofructokinase [Planctomycetes bacterium]|nr:6-phosphofructokinase [Planctomycetota bacterium]
MVDRIIIGESGGPTPVIDWEVAGIIDAAQKAGIEIYGMINGLEGLLNANINGNIVDLTGMDPMSFVFNGPGAGLRTTRMKPGQAQYEKIADNLQHLGVDGIIYIGGNDSADQLRGLTETAHLQTIHAIKTVDNDLPVTHHCPGWGSVGLYNATALKNVYSDFSSYGVKANYRGENGIYQGFEVAPAIVYQVMGRKAGWIAQATAFARVDPKGDMVPDAPPHIILCKEVMFDRQAFLDKVSDTLSRLGECVVVVQEDLTDKEAGESIAIVYGADLQRDDHGNIQHGRVTSFSPAVFLTQLISAELQVDAVPGRVKDCTLNPQHIQRSCMMSRVDAAEAYRVGHASVEAMMAGETGKSVVLDRRAGVTKTALTDIANIAARERQVPAEYINGIEGPTQEFIDEYIYTIGGPVALPHYSKMRFQAVAVPAPVKAAPYVKGE